MPEEANKAITVQFFKELRRRAGLNLPCHIVWALPRVELLHKTKLILKRTSLTLFFLFAPLGIPLLTAPAFAAPPTVGFIIPFTGSTAPDTAKTFICLYSDKDGWKNLKEAYLLISTSPAQLASSAYLYYDQNSNLLYLKNNTNSSWLGGYAPGSNNTIENSQIKLNCGLSSASGSGNTLTVKWNISFKPAYSGKTYNTYLYVRDDTNRSAGWTKKGRMTVLQGTTSDTTPPTGSISINNNAAYTASASVTLSLSAVDSGSGMGSGAQMKFSTDQLSWSTPEAYATAKTWALSSGDGLKIVHVMYKDIAGNWSSPVSDTIVLDLTPPTISISSPANGATVSGTITISASAVDMGGVIAGVQFKLDGVTLEAEDTTLPYQASWNTIAASSGSHTLSAVIRDTAGNTAAASVTIIINNIAAPVVIDDGIWTDSSTQLHAKWSFSDPKGVVEYLYSIGTRPGWTDLLNWSSTAVNEITVTGLTLALRMPYYFNVKAKNGAGLWSEVGSSDGIKYNPPPEICRFTPLDKSSFIEGDTVSIYACTSDNEGDVIEFQVSIDNLILQPWRINAGTACGCSVYNGAALTYNWQTKTGDSGLRKIKVEARDDKAASVFKEITIFIYKKPLGPPS